MYSFIYFRFASTDLFQILKKNRLCFCSETSSWFSIKLLLKMIILASINLVAHKNVRHTKIQDAMKNCINFQPVRTLGGKCTLDFDVCILLSQLH